ncbi:MAG TPA: hypothetical protein DE060_08090 [Lentisphaeria bacterium]|nr:hypothetical protein [Lentisphaeria bacterium]HCG49149.1 hypothetical protein [Lentisphaeria bacterium]
MKRFITSILLFAAVWLHAAVLEGETFFCDFDGKNLVVHSGKDRKKLFLLSGIDMGWKQGGTGNGSLRRNGDGSVTIHYPFKEENAYCEFKISVKGSMLTNEITLKPASKMRLGGQQILRRSLAGNPRGILYKNGIWTRPASDGVPYERAGAVVREFPAGEVSVYEKISGNSEWSDFARQHVNLKLDKDSGLARGAVAYLILPAKRLGVAAAMFAEQGLTVAIPPQVPFNLWKSVSEKPFVTAEISNGASTEKNVSYRIVVRDYDGKVCLDEKGSVTVPAHDSASVRIMPELSGERGIWFVDFRTEQGAFARSMIGVLPEYVFKEPEKSIFGIAAAFDVPSRKEVAKLLRRMGVGWVREMGKSSYYDQIGANALFHSNKSYKVWMGEKDASARNAYIAKTLEQVNRQDTVGWEFPNEWNMQSLNKGAHADDLMKNWYQEIRRQMEEKKISRQLIGPALAGGDIAFLRRIHELGGWNILDGISFHPGRGNMTADYAGREYWSYYGSLQRVRKFLADKPRKPLYLTEVYACTKPNAWWYDSYRMAADNILLMYAIALKEEVTAAFFYQLHDGVWFNIQGVKPSDPEYFYGLLHRDGILKPSLLAFCNIAEQLENAKFVRDLKLEKQLKGFLFEKDGKQFAILWNREEGYFQSAKKPGYRHLEPWISHWKKASELLIPAERERISVVDSIGRKREFAAENGTVSLPLTGSPVIVHGVNVDKLKLSK